MRFGNRFAEHRNAGQVIWITGLSGAGKSTLARIVTERLREQNPATLLLDGDAIREAISDPHVAHDRESRLTNAMRICRLAKLSADQGLIVVVATMSLFQEVFDWNRAHLPGYCEVFLKVGIDVLRQRDPRALYSKANRGEARNVVGIDVDYDTPPAPHLVLVNEGSEQALHEFAEQVIRTTHTRSSLLHNETYIDL